MHSIIKQLLLLISLVVIGSCAQIDTATTPQIREYSPRYIDFTYKIDGKVQIRHSYLFGAGVQKCYYAGELAKPYMDDYQLVYPYQSDEIYDFFEKDGHIYQGDANSDKNVLGSPFTSRLGGDIDPVTGKQKIIVTKLWTFDSFCSGWVAGFGFSLGLQKTSYLSIAEEIAQTKELLGGAWKEFVRWEPETTIQRDNNTWVVFKTWNRAIYLADATEDWYLPVADGAYYYHLAFDYKSSMLKRDPDQYAKGRAMFDHILDSFVVRQLTAEESAATVNPEPIKTDISKLVPIDQEYYKKYQQDLIDRLNRNKNSDEHNYQKRAAALR
jgi:hypothetical protein